MAATDKTKRLVTEAALEDATLAMSNGITQAVSAAGEATEAAADATAAAGEAKAAVEQFSDDIDATMAAKTTEGGEFTTALNAQTDEAVGAVHVNLARGADVDATSALQQANDVAAAAGARLVVTGGPAGMFVGGTVTLTVDTDIQCPLLIGAGGTLNVGAATTFDTLSQSALGGMSEFSSRITGLPATAAGRYLWIDSTETLTERDNPPSNTPYQKRSAVYVLNSLGDITPTLDATYTGSSATVKLFHKTHRIRVRIARTHCVQTTGTSSFTIRIQRDNVDFALGGMTSAGAHFHTSMAVSANGTRLDCPRVDDSQVSGAGYGVSIGLSCNTTITGLTGGRNREALSGRHGALVTIRDSIAEVMDSHWGNDYRFLNCDIGSVLWSGKDLTIQGGTMSGIYPVSVRSDTFLATGRLTVDNVRLGNNSTRLVGPSSFINPSSTLWTTPRRIFDEVYVHNLTVPTPEPFALYAHGMSNTADDYLSFALPHRISIDGVTALASSTFNAVNITGEPVRTMDYSPLIEVRGVLATGRQPIFTGRGFNDPAPARGVTIRIEDCGEIHPQVDANLIERMDIIRCDTQIWRINPKTARGPIFLHGGSVSNSPNVEPTNPVTALGTVFRDAANQYTWAAKRGCLAASGVPASVGQDYTNAAHYATT